MRCIVVLPDLAGACKRLIQIELRGQVLLQMRFKRLREVLQAVQHMIGCGMPQTAMRMMLNQVAEALQLGNITRRAMPAGNFIQTAF